MSERRVWIFQANPRRYDLIGALRDPELEEDVWLVTRYRNEIHEGHFALIWKSGNDRGIYAVVDVISDVKRFVESEQSARYWKNPLDRFQNEKRVRIRRRLNRNGTALLLEDELMSIAGLENLSIINFRHATNFRVTNAEWQIIKLRLHFEE